MIGCRPTALAAIAVTLLTVVLAGCSTMVAPGNAAATATPTDTAVAEATAAPTETAAAAETAAPAEVALTLGIVSFTEPANRSGGVADASAKAAKLAADRLASSASVQVMVLPEARGSGAAKAGGQFAASGAKLVIGGMDKLAVSYLAESMAAGTITTITLAPIADTRLSIYGASLNGRDEALSVLAEAKRLGVSSLVIVVNGTPDSTHLAAPLQALAAQQGISVQLAQTDAHLQSALAQPLSGGSRAVVFTVDPQGAAGMLSRIDPTMAATLIVGNAGWIMAEPLPEALNGGWFPSLPAQSLRKFVQQFRAAYGENPTLPSAMLYDLVIMAVALDVTAGEQAFTDTRLQDVAGFTGFSGHFAFGAAGLVQPRTYEIVQIRR
jgi:hypothetical protein